MQDGPELLLTSTHEWVQIKKGKRLIVGISDHAQTMLSNVTGVELPEPDEQSYDMGEELGVVESLHNTLPFHAPVSGRIVKINTELFSRPELINTDPYGEGWLIEMMADNLGELDELMSQDDYETSFPDEDEE